jgi:hypothetical protein
MVDPLAPRGAPLHHDSDGFAGFFDRFFEHMKPIS